MPMDVRGARDTIDQVRSALEQATSSDDLAARVSEVRDRLRAALRAVDEAIRTGRAGAKETASGAAGSLEKELREAERAIRDNPFGAVLLAAGLGLLVGLVVRRR